MWLEANDHILFFPVNFSIAMQFVDVIYSCCGFTRYNYVTDLFLQRCLPFVLTFVNSLDNYGITPFLANLGLWNQLRRLSLSSYMEVRAIACIRCLSVRPKSSNTSHHYIFLIFCIKLAYYKRFLVTKPDFRKKNYLALKWPKMVKIGPKMRFLAIFWRLRH